MMHCTPDYNFKNQGSTFKNKILKINQIHFVGSFTMTNMLNADEHNSQMVKELQILKV